MSTGENNIQTLRNALFNQLARLTDDSLNQEKETLRANALVAVSSQIIATAKVEIDYAKLTGGKGGTNSFLASGNEQKQLSDGTGEA